MSYQFDLSHTAGKSANEAPATGPRATAAASVDLAAAWGLRPYVKPAFKTIEQLQEERKLFVIKEGSAFVRKEPIVGRWYCAFERVYDFDTGEEHDSGGSLGEYIGNGEFVDEDGSDIGMANDWLVLQH